MDDIKFMTGYNVEPVVASETAVTDAIKRYYPAAAAAPKVAQKAVEKKPEKAKPQAQPGLTSAATLELVTKALEETTAAVVDDDVELLEELEQIDVASLERQGGEAPVIRLVNLMLMSAIQKGASDIHIEPYEKEFRVRFRIDGILYNVMAPPMKFRDAITSRIKIMAKLDIAEKRLPQDGRIKIRFAVDGALKEIDFRVSCLPTLFGEKIVMRLLDKDKLMLDMTKLGFEAESLSKLEVAIGKPWGLVLVTGPTGSGKTNTLYSSISKVNTTETNIMTAEDPVEFNLVGVNQVQVRENIGLNFAAALRSFLRQDPNIILVGEIRDFETAEIAVKAALTGHLVLSTLHTNDAPSTINRLMNMGIEPFLVASSVNLICAQRLVRRVCAAVQGRPPDAAAGARRRRLHARRSAERRPQARHGLRGLQPDGLQGPRRPLRGHGDHRRAARADSRRRLGSRAEAQGRRGRHDHAPPQRLAQGHGRRDDDRGSGAGDDEIDMATLPELLQTLVDNEGSDLHLTTQTPPQIRVHGKLQVLDLPPLGAGRHQDARLQRADRRAEEAVRGDARARLLVRYPGRRALPLQRVQPARRRRRRLPGHPREHQAVPRARPAGRSSATCPSGRAGWCSSPARPAAASRRRWRR